MIPVGKGRPLTLPVIGPYSLRIGFAGSLSVRPTLYGDIHGDGGRQGLQFFGGAGRPAACGT